jgi:hypothetical protein
MQGQLDGDSPRLRVNRKGLFGHDFWRCLEFKFYHLSASSKLSVNIQCHADKGYR